MNPYMFMTRMDAVRPTKQNKMSSIFGTNTNNKIVGVFALLVVLGGFYVYQINQLAILGYEVKNGEKENAKLQKEVTQLKVDVEKMKMADNLQAKTQDLNMVQSKNVSYVYASDSGLAMASDISGY